MTLFTNILPIWCHVTTRPWVDFQIPFLRWVAFLTSEILLFSCVHTSVLYLSLSLSRCHCRIPHWHGVPGAFKSPSGLDEVLTSFVVFFLPLMTWYYSGMPHSNLPSFSCSFKKALPASVFKYLLQSFFKCLSSCSGNAVPSFLLNLLKLFKSEFFLVFQEDLGHCILRDVYEVHNVDVISLSPRGL